MLSRNSPKPTSIDFSNAVLINQTSESIDDGDSEVINLMSDG